MLRSNYNNIHQVKLLGEPATENDSRCQIILKSSWRNRQTKRHDLEVLILLYSTSCVRYEIG